MLGAKTIKSASVSFPCEPETGKGMLPFYSPSSLGRAARLPRGHPGAAICPQHSALYIFHGLKCSHEPFEVGIMISY